MSTNVSGRDVDNAIWWPAFLYFKDILYILIHCGNDRLLMSYLMKFVADPVPNQARR